MALLRALLYLRLTSAKNVVRGRLRRLRQPKYLVGAIAGAMYVWFFFLRRAGAHTPGQSLALAFGAGRAEIFAAIILSAFLLLTWLLPTDNPGLAFTEPEVAFLFPAPLTRRQLIHYKLLDGLMTSLISAFFFALISSGLRNGWLGALRHFGAWWVLNANLSLHNSAASLTISRLASAGLSTARRRVTLLIAAGLALVGLAFAAHQFGLAKLGFLLWPARLVVRPFLADSAHAYLLALLPALGLLVLQYAWVHRLESPFEEASIVRARKTADMIAQMRAGKGVRLGGGKPGVRRAPFALGPRLPAEFALLWKNLMAAPPYLNRKVFLGAAVVLGGGAAWLQGAAGLEKLAPVAGVIALALVGYLLVFGPQLARNDLRSDLLNADMLKAWPLPGWRVVLGELLAPVVFLTAIAWILLLVAAICLSPALRAAPWLTPGLRVAALAACTVILPFLCTLQLLVPNGATLLFPAWSQTGRPASGGGVDIMGQRLIFFLGQFLCLVLALFPAVIAAGLTIFLTQWLIGPAAAVLLAVVPVLAILGVEIWLGLHWVGLKFEALDISAELRP